MARSHAKTPLVRTTQSHRARRATIITASARSAAGGWTRLDLEQVLQHLDVHCAPTKNQSSHVQATGTTLDDVLVVVAGERAAKVN